MAGYLDPVVQEFVANAERYIGPVLEMAKAAGNAADANDKLVVSVEALRVALSDTDAGSAAAALEGLSSRLDDTRDAFLEAGAATSSLTRRFGKLVTRSALLRTALAVLDEELDKKAAALLAAGVSASVLAAAMTTAAAAAGIGTAAVAKSGQVASVTAGFWARWGTVIHWVVAGTTEFLAVAIPAAVAAGAWAFVWLQGATQVYQHMNALFTATEALGQAAHQTYGEELGLSGAFQRAQNAADPNVYQALGSALEIVKETAGGLAQTGLQVGQIFDTFLAHVVYYFSAAGHGAQQLHALLAGMIPDLVKFGQVFGNLGHFIANFAEQMPGLAEVLLTVLAGFTHLLVAVTNFTAGIRIGRFTLLTMAMAFEEFNRWGTLVIGMFLRMGLGTVALEGSMFGFGRALLILRNIFGILPNLIFTASQGLARLGEGLAVTGEAIVVTGATMPVLGAETMVAGAAIETLGGEAITAAFEVGALAAAMEAAIASMGPLELLFYTLALVGIGILIDKLVTARTAAQQFADAIQAAADKATNLNVMTVLATGIGKLNAEITSTTTSMGRYAAAGAQVGTAITSAGKYASDAVQQQTTLSNQYAQGASDVRTYTAAQHSLEQQYQTVATRTAQLAGTYHTTLLGAMILADAAGVHLNQTMTKQAWALAQIKVGSLVQGYMAMGQPLGLVGKDMTAVAIQTGLAGTKISQLNQAWDDFMQNLTSGTGALSGFEESLSQIGIKAATTKDNLDTATGTMSLSMQTFASSLKTYTGTGAQAWENFDQVVGSTAPQLLDFLRIAGAEGAISGRQFTQAARDMVAQLLPLASHSKAAVSELSGLAQEADGPATDSFKTLKGWVDQSKTSTKNLSDTMNQATVQMGDMSAVAQQLGTVMQSDIINAMGDATIQASKVTQGTLNFENALRNNNFTAAASDAQILVKELEFLGENASQARQMVQILEGQILGLHSKTINLFVNTVYGSSGTAPPAGGSTGGLGHINAGDIALPVHLGHAGGIVVIHQHVAGSVIAEQNLARIAVQASARQTFRNPTNQLFLKGRGH